MKTQRVAADWQLHIKAETTWLTCDLLAGWSHGFFTRLGAQQPEACAEILGLDGTRALWLHQIHSAIIQTPEQLLTEGDALITHTPGTSVWVSSADCVPILVATDTQVAAIHAGWRGTAQKILPLTLRALQERGANLATLKIAIGPAISQPRYPVGADVAQQVLATLGLTTAASHLDVKAINYQQALNLGVNPEHIAMCEYCTFDTPELFYSYRRDGRSGVQRSGIAPVSSAPT